MIISGERKKREEEKNSRDRRTVLPVCSFPREEERVSNTC